MSQKNKTLHFVIHDVNGQQQKIKVIQNSNNSQTIEREVKIKSSPLKIIKVTPHNKTQGPGSLTQSQKAIQLSCVSKSVQFSSNTIEELQCPPKKVIKIEIEEDKEESSNSNYQELSQLQELTYIETVPDIVPQPVRSVTLSSTSSAEDLSVMSQTTRRRRDSDNDAPPEYTTKRRRHADKVGKGLRHFSMKVCEKVRNKGFTSYNEVADELVLEFSNGMHGSGDTHYDQKNIRRRVYDALNVLMAMNIISKDKKEIRWLGLPTNSLQECNTLEREKQQKIDQIQKKTQQLQELILQHISFKSLIERNKEAESKGVKPSPSSAIHLPFIVVNTSEKALIDCSISNDKTEYMFNFNKRFQIHDDIDILKRMGLLFGLDKGECTEQEIEKAKSMVPKSLESYVEQMGRGETSKLASIIKEEDLDESNEDTVSTQGEAEADDDAEHDAEDDDANDYSEDDSSDVDV